MNVFCLKEEGKDNMNIERKGRINSEQAAYIIKK